MFPELDRERLKFLFRAGLSRVRIKRFLDERKPALMMNGAQYRRRAEGAEADLNFLVNLPQKCLPIVRQWCLEQLEISLDLRPEALIAQFSAVELTSDSLSGEQAKNFAAMGLKYLMQADPPQAWLDFLRTPIGPPPSPSSDSTQEGNVDACPVSPLLELLSKLRQDDGDGARESLKKIPDGPLNVELGQLISRHRARFRETDSLPRPLRVLEDVKGLDPERVAVLIQRTRHAHAGQPVFLDIRGLYVDAALYALSEDQSVALFEHRYHVIGFPDDKAVRVPSQGELSLWYVEKYPTDKPIKYRLRKQGPPLYVVIPLAASFDDCDQVRIAIQSAYVEPWMRPIFQLARGGFVRAAADVAPQTSISLDKPLLHYHSLPMWDVGGTGVVASPLPPPDGEYDCADLTVITSRLLRDAEVRRQLPQMTRAQLDTFAEALKASALGLTEQRLARITQEFDRYITSADRLQQISAAIIESASVKALIESAKQAAIEQARAENQELRDERARLQKELGELRERRLAAIEESRRTAEEIRKTVRRAFEKAREAGVELLGESALFATLLPRDLSQGDSISNSRAEIEVSVLEPSANLQHLLVEVGLPISIARIVSLGARCVAAVGLPLVITGARAAQVAGALGRGLAHGRCVVGDIPIGLIDARPMRSMLEGATKADTLVIRNHNLSAFEVYGTPLMDEIVRGVVSNKAPRAAIVFSVARGAASLPVDDELSAMAVTIDLSGDFASENLDVAATLARLHDDRGATRPRSVALARLLDGFASTTSDEARAVLAIISSHNLGQIEGDTALDSMR